MNKKTTTAEVEEKTQKKAPKKETKKTTAKTARKPRTTKKAQEVVQEEVPEVQVTQEAVQAEQPKVEQPKVEQPKVEQPKVEQPKVEQPKVEQPKVEQPRVFTPLPLPTSPIRNIVELAQAPQRAIILTDQQIQQLTLEEIEKRHLFLENTLAQVLDYDVVVSDTNVWLELLVGHTSSHSDPRVNARLQFERQLEFISKLSLFRGGKFMMMGETYEEIDRFASLQDPTNHKEADFTDNLVCLNTAARLAKRLILAQQRENRLRIEGISAESHHAAFADPAIIRRVVELFAQGKKVLLLTNDASVAIRSMGLCDDLQRWNNISDDDWNEHYAPLRPMVFTFEDLKLLDFYTRQYHYISMASAMPWMGTVARKMQRASVESLSLNLDAFRPGDRRKGDNLNPDQITEKNTSSSHNQKAQQQKAKQQQQQKQQPKQQPKQEQPKQEQPKQQPKQEQPKQEQPKQEQPKQQPKPVEDNVKVENVAEPQQAEQPKESQNSTKTKQKSKSRRKPQRPQKSSSDVPEQTSETPKKAENAE